MHNKQLETLLTILKGLEAPILQINMCVAKIYEKIIAAEHLKILMWLSDIPVEDHHLFVSSRRNVGDGSWLLNKQQFREWERSESSSILWLHGIRKLNPPCWVVFSELILTYM